jgi:O-acetyl-ADP-ribose deacetylase (regulator of RNase III)
MGLSSVAMPLLGTGVGGLDMVEVATAMAAVLAELAGEGRCRDMTVLLVGYDEEASDAVRRAVEAQ